MKIIISLACSVIFLFSCNPQAENPSKTNSSSAISANDTFHLIKELKGLLIHAKDEKRFVPCDTPDLLYIVENNDQTNIILDSILPKAYEGEAIFLQIEAEIKPSADKKYTALLSIKKFLKAEQKNPANTCIPFDFWCKGNEPFWQLQISEKENLIDFYDPMQQRTTHFAYSKQEITDDVITYSSKDENVKNNIFIRIKNEKCFDGMSEKKYNYSVEVVLNNKKYKGCALKYGDRW
jgi:uncharacterized membrane protein